MHDNRIKLSSMFSISYFKRILSVPILPLIIVCILCSVNLTDDLFGDEFAQYRWSTMNSNPYGFIIYFDVSTQLAKLGYLLVGEPWAIRLYSIVFSLGTIVLVWMVAKLLFGIKTAIVASWITTLSPYFLEFATEARPNAIFIFSGILFLYALLCFIKNESWPNTILLIFSSCFGLMARPMFIAILIFGFSYYLLNMKKVTLKFLLISLSIVPFIVLVLLQAKGFFGFGPKESTEVSPSILNLLLRLLMSFNFGFSTLNYPERDLGWNISIYQIISHNLIYVIFCVLLFCVFIIGLMRIYKKYKSKVLFLVGAALVPLIILIVVQETKYSLLNEKHCAGIVGVYYILMAVIIIEISPFLWGKAAVLLYIFIVNISLFHFYIQPEVYSRRSSTTALNSYLIKKINTNDLVLGYCISVKNYPNYLTVLESEDCIVEINTDMLSAIELNKYVRAIRENNKSKIFLIYDSRLRSGVDPDNYVLSYLREHCDFNVLHYGRNLKLYEFFSEKTDQINNIATSLE